MKIEKKIGSFGMMEVEWMCEIVFQPRDKNFIEFLATIETQQSHKPTEIIAYAIKDIGRLSHKEKPLISSNNNYFSTILNTWKEKAVDRKLYKGGCYYVPSIILKMIV